MLKKKKISIMDDMARSFFTITAMIFLIPGYAFGTSSVPLCRSVSYDSLKKEGFSVAIQKDLQQWENWYEAVKIGHTSGDTLVSMYEGSSMCLVGADPQHAGLRPRADEQMDTENIRDGLITTSILDFENGRITSKNYKDQANEHYLQSWDLNIDDFNNYYLVSYGLMWKGSSSRYSYQFRYAINKMTNLIEKKNKMLLYCDEYLVN